jgi:predicted anti-sigma-YlaC factor YlaD
MTCAQMRIAISALLDGEEPGIPRQRVRGHLASCPGCRDWQSGAQRVSAEALAQVPEPPDLTERVLAALPAAKPPLPAVKPPLLGAGPLRVLRLALAVSAAAQLALAIPLLFSLASGGGHQGREMASFDVAVAVGFLLAAARPSRAAALVPVALALVLCLFASAAVDLARENTQLTQEAGHLVVVLQAGALWLLGRSSGSATSARRWLRAAA